MISVANLESMIFSFQGQAYVYFKISTLQVVFLIKPCNSIIASFEATEIIPSGQSMINKGKVKLKILEIMGNNDETTVVGSTCTLLYPYKGYTEGEVIDDYGYELLVRLTNGKELSIYRDELIIHD